MPDELLLRAVAHFVCVASILGLIIALFRRTNPDDVVEPEPGERVIGSHRSPLRRWSR